MNFKCAENTESLNYTYILENPIMCKIAPQV